VAAHDRRYMDEALRLAKSVRGRTAPNPAVGAVVVRDGTVVGRGATRPHGGAHAEVVALREAGGAARGATVYVTLEPCCHHGCTPPCTAALLNAGIARCVVATEDPFPAVAGAGIARLRGAGIRVDVGLCRREATVINAGFFHRIATDRPLITAKYAMTLDGRIATRTRHSRWMTGEVAREMVHRLRDRTDAIMVGAGTVLTDDPSLTTRLPMAGAGEGGPHHPLRIIIDGRGTCPPDSRVFSPDLPGQTLVVTSSVAPWAWREALIQQGVELWELGEGPWVNLGALVQCLGERGVNDLLVEGGGRLHGGLFDLGLVDRVAAFIAPVLVGGDGAPAPVGGEGVATMSDAWRLDDVLIKRLGDDLLVEGAVCQAGTEAA
jgi:diaminohydroxyphosphoribosylaminopyrimidine deaminase/5-amino-6-(5-phosphoribosylamino)uracil reductase